MRHHLYYSVIDRIAVEVVSSLRKKSNFEQSTVTYVLSYVFLDVAHHLFEIALQLFCFGCGVAQTLQSSLGFQ